MGLGTQSCYEGPGDLWVKIVENTVISIRLMRLPAQEWPKDGFGTAKYHLKKACERKRGIYAYKL